MTTNSKETTSITVVINIRESTVEWAIKALESYCHKKGWGLEEWYAERVTRETIREETLREEEYYRNLKEESDVQ